MCGVYDNHVGFFGNDLNWKGIFLALWRIFA
jgi:hypothetical protein